MLMTVLKRFMWVFALWFCSPDLTNCCTSCSNVTLAKDSKAMDFNFVNATLNPNHELGTSLFPPRHHTHPRSLASTWHHLQADISAGSKCSYLCSSNSRTSAPDLLGSLIISLNMKYQHRSSHASRWKNLTYTFFASQPSSFQAHLSTVPRAPQPKAPFPQPLPSLKILHLDLYARLNQASSWWLFASQLWYSKLFPGMLLFSRILLCLDLVLGLSES